MIVKTPAWLPHHALKALPFAAVASDLTTNIRGRHWAINATYWILLAATTVLLTLGIHHAYEAPCPHCKTKPAERLRRPHYRAVVGISRRAGLPLAIIVIPFLIVAPLIWGDGHGSDSVFEWKQDAVRSGIALAITAFLSAIRFDHANNPDYVRPTPITTFLRQRATSLTHKGHWLLLLSLLPVTVANFLPHTDAWSPIGYLSLLLMLSAGYINAEHSRSLCEECVTEFPQDAPQYAAQRQWRFTAAHRLTRQLIMLAVIVMVLGELFLPHPWNDVAGLPPLVIVGFMALLSRFHNSYQPWCPYCHWDYRGGEKEDAPDPTDDHGRPLPFA